tara:strand:- start:6540 stop:6833 length:294 start_codon:yes stop_codon:yes gene_type:complete
MPLIANSLFESVPFCRTESEYTEMALKDIILPITQFGENNIGVNDIDIALGDTFTSNMISHKENKIPMAIPIYDHNNNAQKAIPIINGQRLCEYLFS